MINLKIINKQITQYIIVETANDFRTEIKISKIITISQQFKIFLRYFWFYLFTSKKKKCLLKYSVLSQNIKTFLINNTQNFTMTIVNIFRSDTDKR